MAKSIRQRAKQLGEKYYFTGRPCKHGHIAKRYTSKGICFECNKQHNLSAGSRAAKLKYVNKDREAHNRRGREFYARNLEQELERGRIYRENNRESLRIKSKEYRKVHLPEHAHKQGKRRAQKINATPNWLTNEQENEIQFLYATADMKHVDHIVPLVSPIVCGLHVPWNLQLLTPKENIEKGNKLNPAQAINYQAPGWILLNAKRP